MACHTLLAARPAVAHRRALASRPRRAPPRRHDATSARRCCACAAPPLVPMGCVYRAVAVPSLEPPYDTIHLRVLHPVEPPAGGPSPVVLFLGAANVPTECYTWLAARLAAAGYVTALPSAVLRYGTEAALLPLPYDVAKLASWELYRTGPAAEGAALVLAELRKLNDARGGPLYRALDLDNVVLGGHSTGGRAALELVAWAPNFPEVAGVFAYGATLDNEPRRMHLERPGMPGAPLLRPFQRFAPPLLLLGGSADASLSAPADVADTSADDDADINAQTLLTAPPPPPELDCVSGLRRVLWQGIEGGTGDPSAADAVGSGGTTGGAVLAVLANGTYGTPCHPLDPAAAFADADFGVDADTSESADVAAQQAALRDALAELVVHFLDAQVAPPGWPPGGDVAEAGERGGPPPGGPSAEGLGALQHASRAARACCWPPEPDEYPLTELKYSPPAADALAAFAAAPPTRLGEDGAAAAAHAAEPDTTAAPPKRPFWGR